MIDTFRIGAVILAGGRGSRMHSAIQKQYMLLNGRPLISYALEVFEQSCADELVLVTGAGEESYVREEILPVLGLTKLRAVVTGGKERYHSVYEGLKALQHCDYVLIHEGARPLVTEEIISRAAQAAVSDEACVVGMPVKDTIKVADAGGFAESTPDRSRLWQVQTPQAFSVALLKSSSIRSIFYKALFIYFFNRIFNGHCCYTRFIFVQAVYHLINIFHFNKRSRSIMY